mmetsp:Transcript_34669/g.73861  ORF Transcript_34669/g.73861 Transcript_34669/m.73861 type:complete len:355 (-) Transcript_34669:10-1074(-)
MSASDKRSLERRLAKLLSISIDDDREYVVDVLDSLIDISDPDDIVEYLSSFIAAGGDDDDGGGGGGGGNLRRFARDVKKFEAGEVISSAEIADAEPTTCTPPASAVGEAKSKPKILDEAAAQREQIRLREIEAREKQRQEQLDLKQKKWEEEQKRRREAAAAAKERQTESRWGKKAEQRGKKPADVKKEQSNKGTTTDQPQGVAAPKKKEPKVSSAKKQQYKPQSERGTPKKRACGCYGNRHKPLTNCLRCGRISCEVEGVNDYCHFCGYFVGEFSSDVGDAENDSAVRHKERLLEFDRTSASRTHVHDDQEDYFAASTNMWATQQEQEDAERLEEERQQKLQRQKQVLKISFE